MINTRKINKRNPLKLYDSKMTATFKLNLLRWNREWLTIHRPLCIWTKRGLFHGSSNLTYADYVTQSKLNFCSLIARWIMESDLQEKIINDFKGILKYQCIITNFFLLYSLMLVYYSFVFSFFYSLFLKSLTDR